MITSDNENKSAPKFRRSFGVGCWDFGLTCDFQRPLLLKQYISRLRQELEAVSSLNNLEILTLGEEDQELEVHEGSHVTPETEEAIFSGHLLRYVTFDLYIPFRIQEELCDSRTASITETEHFRVHICYPYYGSVAYVELLTSESARHPSSAVRVVREYMDSQLHQLDCNVVFTYLGPSPFHADFFIEGYGNQQKFSNKLQVEKRDQPGYADIVVRFCDDDVKTTEDAFEIVFDQLSDEFSLFYMIERNEQEMQERWSSIEQITEQLARTTTQVGWRQKLRTWRSRGRDLASLYLTLAKFQMDHTFASHHAETVYHHTYGQNKSYYVRDYIDSSVKERREFPTKQLTQLLQFIENRRSKEIELAIIVVAAIIGGVVGSLVTLVASG